MHVYDIRGDEVTNEQTRRAALGLLRGDHRSFGVAWYATKRQARKAQRKGCARGARTTSGQGIAADSVIERIYAATHTD